MAKVPAFQFYTGDWLKDPKLRQCCATTRGIWIDMLAAMHENDRSGVITGTVDGLARMCGCTTEEMTRALEELHDTETADVTNSHGKVTVINRRMSKEAKERKSAKYRKQKQREGEQRGEGHAAVTEKSRSHSSSSKDSSSDQPPDPPAFTLADFPKVDPQVWADFEEHRKAIRKPLTDMARKLSAEFLSKLPPEQQRESVNESIRSRWTGLYPPKGNGAGSQQPRRLGKLARAMEVLNERTRGSNPEGPDRDAGQEPRRLTGGG